MHLQTFQLLAHCLTLKRGNHFQYYVSYSIERSRNMKNFLIATILFLSIFLIPNNVLATTYDLIAPSQLTRGQDAQFVININTEGKSLSSSAIGMTYDTQYLEYVSVSPGDTFTTVSADIQGTGRLIITGSSTSPYSGSGTFAYVTFKLIATQAGSTQLCVLFNPTSSTPTPGPTSTPGPTITPGGPTVTPGPIPTSLPKTGESTSAVQGIFLASLFFIVSVVGFFVLRKT